MRYLMKVGYDGTNYCGWQKQDNKPTIQGILEDKIKQITGEEICLFASGRTDAMVSAISQVVHFDAESLKKDFVGHLNAVLPADIRVQSVVETDPSFNARYDAKRKTYRYYFYTSKVENPYYDRFASHIKYNLNLSTMQNAIKSLNGEHNFKCFCAMHSSVKDYVRTIYNATINCNNGLYVVEVTGNGFLYNMVRIIVGTLIDIGRGKLTKSMDEIILSQNRENAGKTAEAKGLVLVNVEYGKQK